MLLEIGRDGESGRTVEWSGDRPLVIGRGRDVDLPLQDPLLSRRHCQLEFIDGRIWAADLGSANGTYLNATRITRTALAPSDLLTFGNFWLRLAADQPTVRKRRSDSGSGDETTRRASGPAEARPPPPPPGAAPRATDDTDSGHPRIDGYEVIAVLGAGSFGKVFRARKLDTGTEVAIKVLPTGHGARAEVVARFLREIEATGQLHHPNLVGVLGAGEGDGFAYLVMEYVQGETLARRLQRAGGGRIEPLAALGIARQIVSGLEHAFARGFVHRDVKPENILVDERGTAKLCDFGLVKSLGTSAQQGLTRPGQGFGSVAYMPPEQVKSAYVADQRADIYSIGATLYHMLTGKRPYSGQVTKGLLRRVLEEMPEPIHDFAPDCPAPVVRLVEKALQKDPDDRYQTPAELLQAIDACIAQLETGVGPAVRSIRSAVTVAERPALALVLEGEGAAAPAPVAAAATPATAGTVSTASGGTKVPTAFSEAATDSDHVAPGFASATTDSDRVAPGAGIAELRPPLRDEEAFADFVLDAARARAAPIEDRQSRAGVPVSRVHVDPPNGATAARPDAGGGGAGTGAAAGVSVGAREPGPSSPAGAPREPPPPGERKPGLFRRLLRAIFGKRSAA